MALAVHEYFAVWKEIYNLAREDSLRRACALQLMRKYMEQWMGDARRGCISNWRSNWMRGKAEVLGDEEKDRIFAEALAKASSTIPMLWESEKAPNEWIPHEPSVCAQLEDAITRQKDQLAVTSQRKSFLMWIHGRTQIDVATGRNHGLRRRKPEIIYKTVAPADDLTVHAPKIPGAGGSSSKGGKPPKSPTSKRR